MESATSAPGYAGRSPPDIRKSGHDIREVAAYYRQVEEELKRSGDFRFEEQSCDPQAASAASDAGNAK